MKKLIIFLSLCLFIFLGIFLFRAKKNGAEDIARPQKHNKLYEIASAPLKLSEPLRLVVNPKTASSEKPETAPAWCQAQWDRLLSLGSIPFKDGLKSNEYKDIETCFEFIPNSKFVKTAIDATCKLENGIIENEQLCSSSLFMYRALLVDLGTSSDKNFGKMPLQILLNKIHGRFMQGEDVWKGSADELRVMALAVKDIEPNNPNSYRVLGMVEMILGDYSNALDYAKQGLAIDQTDMVLRDMWFFNQAIYKKSELAAYVSAHPNDDVAKYYFGANLWKDGKLDEARNIVKDLVARHPNSSRYKNTWRKVSNFNDASERPFQIDIPMLQEGW